MRGVGHPLGVGWADSFSGVLEIGLSAEIRLCGLGGVGYSVDRHMLQTG